jgi:hypothetical protein
MLNFDGEAETLECVGKTESIFFFDEKDLTIGFDIILRHARVSSHQHKLFDVRRQTVKTVGVARASLLRKGD